MTRSKFLSKLPAESKVGYKPIFRRIFSRPKTMGDLLKQTLLFVLYFWPSIYFTLTGTWLE